MGTSHSDSGVELTSDLPISATTLRWGSSTWALTTDPYCVSAMSVASSEGLSKFHKLLEIAGRVRVTFRRAVSCAARNSCSFSCHAVTIVTVVNTSTLMPITQSSTWVVSGDRLKDRIAIDRPIGSRERQKPAPRSAPLLCRISEYYGPDISRVVETSLVF